MKITKTKEGNITYCVLLIISLISIINIMSCRNNNSQLLIKHESNDHTNIFITHVRKYLLIPIEEKANEAKVKVTADNQEDLILNVRLAVNSVDYFVPFDLSVYKNMNPQFSIEGISESALCWSEIKLSDDFDTSNREKFRPVYHFSPQYGWMNDPNGMVYWDGEYHLYYQHNPYSSMWGNMHWGHAISKDLITWQHLPVAIAPDSLGTIFSGSAIVDKENVSGFGKNAIIAFYTSAGECQSQSIAYSLDNGRTFTKYKNNPVITADIPDFRDPKVFYHEPTHNWIMVLAAGQEIQLYSSNNMREWNYESSFGHGYGNHQGVWECPDLIELPVDGNQNNRKWVLLLNINPGGLFGGSATQYFIGQFDGKVFTSEDSPETVKWMDWGKDHYATITWSNAPDNRAIAIAWMSNWQYANNVPTQQYRSANSVPRDLSLFTSGKNVYLASNPSPEIASMRSETKEFTLFPINREYNIDSILENNEGSYEIEMDLTIGKAEVIGFQLFNEDGENVDIYFHMPEKKIYMDRRQSGITSFSEHFPAVTWAPLERNSTYKVRILVDKCSVEMFVNDGKISMTNLVFPSQPYNRMSFYSKGGAGQVDNMKIHRLTLK